MPTSLIETTNTAGGTTLPQTLSPSSPSSPSPPPPPPLDEAKRRRVLQQALHDPFFSETYKQLGSVEALIAAGIVDMGEFTTDNALPAGEDWLMTPTYHISRRLSELTEEALQKPLLVLLTTGGFCPAHPGHHKMLELARAALEAQGNIVLGGYFAPDHDAYVLRKCGSDALRAIYRMRLLEEELKSTDWLMADGWPSLGVERDLNFTDIILRLERYLHRHVKSPRKIEVVYVFGGDNAGFARAFLGYGRCACVLRPGSEQTFFAVANDPLVQNNPHITMVDESSLDMASKAVRQGRQALEEGVQEMYARWANAYGRAAPTAQTAVYFLRNEAGWSIEPWCVGRNRRSLAQHYRRFREELMQVLTQAHVDATEADVKFDVSFHLLNIAKQRRASVIQARNEPVISLDPCVAGQHNIAVSRIFPVCSGRISPGITARPGSPSLEEQIKAIPAGEYVLQDDDIVTGGTMRQIQSRLPDDVRIKRWSSLTDRETEQKLILDIIDTRDFLAGAREGGLVVELPDRRLARAPYSLPYVSPAHGARTPLSQEIAVARAIWELNERFFSRIQPAITVKETNVGFKVLMDYLGFGSDTPMTEVCRWHIDHSLGFGIGAAA
jgi:hypothetical protein